MKKWVFVVLVAFFVAGCQANKPSREPVGISQVPGVAGPQEQVQVTPEQVYQGKLILVNKDHPVREWAVPSDLVNPFERDNGIRLSQSVAKAFAEMVRAGVGEEVNRFAITSGYRNHAEQKALYQQMGSDYALPAGFSEHNTGLALDIGSTRGNMDQAPEGMWLRKNAWKYGFVLRYPKDKVAITGIQYEPWHFRYVGLPHSAIMQQKGMVLEEYWDYVEERGSLLATVDGQVFELYYYPVSNNTTIPVPSDRQYEISGNNRDGVLVTVFPK